MLDRCSARDQRGAGPSFGMFFEHKIMPKLLRRRALCNIKHALLKFEHLYRAANLPLVVVVVGRVNLICSWPHQFRKV